jgi:hypothetical protein
VIRKSIWGILVLEFIDEGRERYGGVFSRVKEIAGEGVVAPMLYSTARLKITPLVPDWSGAPGIHVGTKKCNWHRCKGFLNVNF